MKTILLLVALVAVASFPAAQAMKLQQKMNENPIRRVVTMMQNMAKEVEAEGEKEKELFEKFMCYCNGNAGDLAAEVEAARVKIPQLESQIVEDTATKARLEQEISAHKKDIAENEDALQKATGIRDKESSEFSAEASDSRDNIFALKQAIPTLEKGMAGEFLQTHAAKLQKVMRRATAYLSPDESDTVNAFLQGKQDYKPASGEIVGILKNMLDSFAEDLQGAIEHEEVAKKTYEELRAAKTDELNAAKKAVEEKTGRVGELATRIASAKEDLEDTKASLSDNEKFMADLKNLCEQKKKDWDVRCKTRADERKAISEAISVLNDDDALDLFKKTMPTPEEPAMLIQTRVQSRANAFRAADLIRAALKNAPGSQVRMRSIALAVMSAATHKVDFTKVLKMIDDMKAVLAKEQKDDDEKKEWCEAEFRKSKNKKEDTESEINSIKITLSEANEAVANLVEELAQLQKEIKDLDASVVEAGVQRKAENKEYLQNVAELRMAGELILRAKDKLNAFYNPDLVSEAGKQEAAEAQEAANKEFMQYGAAPPPPPETWGAYQKKDQQSNGVMAMMDTMKNDLEKEALEAEHDEKDSQKEYEELMADSQEKREIDSKSITDKEAEKGTLENKIVDNEENKKNSQAELEAVLEYIQNLHTSCDFILENFDVRKSARATETDNLTKAKAILSGADFSFVQQKTALRRAK